MKCLACTRKSHARTTTWPQSLTKVRHVVSVRDKMTDMSDPVDESFVDEYLKPQSSPAPIEKTRQARQGLPSGYRMRHDAHYVDELESRRRSPDAAAPTL